MDNRINTAIIGFGLSGRVFHAPIITRIPEFNLSKIYTTNTEKIHTAKALYPNTNIVSDINEIMADENIQLIVVASSNTSHFSIARDAILSNKHVVVEKPFTVTSEEAETLIQLAEKHSRVLSVYHNRRWDSDFRTVRKVVTSKLLGNLVECEIHYDRFRNFIKENAWREEDIPGSGMLYDLGSHLIDQAQCLFGLPENIYADLRIQRYDGRVVDNFEIILGYKNIKVTLKSGMLIKEPLPRYILLGDEGTFVKYGTDIQEGDLNSGYTPLTKSEWGKESEEFYGTINTTINGLNIRGKVTSENGDYREYYKNIYGAIMKKEELAVTPSQARDTIRIIELAMESSRTKKIVEFK